MVLLRLVSTSSETALLTLGGQTVGGVITQYTVKPDKKVQLMVLNMMLIHQVRDMLMPIIFLIFQERVMDV